MFSCGRIEMLMCGLFKTGSGSQRWLFCVSTVQLPVSSGLLKVSRTRLGKRYIFIYLFIWGAVKSINPYCLRVAQHTGTIYDIENCLIGNDIRWKKKKVTSPSVLFTSALLCHAWKGDLMEECMQFWKLWVYRFFKFQRWWECFSFLGSSALD